MSMAMPMALLLLVAREGEMQTWTLVVAVVAAESKMMPWKDRCLLVATSTDAEDGEDDGADVGPIDRSLGERALMDARRCPTSAIWQLHEVRSLHRRWHVADVVVVADVVEAVASAAAFVVDMMAADVDVLVLAADVADVAALVVADCVHDCADDGITRLLLCSQRPCLSARRCRCYDRLWPCCSSPRCVSIAPAANVVANVVDAANAVGCDHVANLSLWASQL
mmetsp:Transcript_9104/g.24582  ORF Transcript_9104/g.24582 Transcript_9104/m.24582 type:complete len:224 (+) Transcript_9104:260-931(+)